VAGSVLITGAGGFVGSHLVRELGERASPTAADVTSPDEVAQALRDAKPAAVVHLAAGTSVAESWERGAEVWGVNVVGTVNVLDAVRNEQPGARVLVVSSGEVYGETPSGLAQEEDDPVAPVSPYAASKVAAEVAADRAARVDGLDVVVARPFPHTGPGQDTRFALGSWTRQIAELELRDGGVLEVGDLSVERDLLDVRDVCRAYRLLVDPGVPAGIYNVASGRAARLEDVVAELVRLARCPVEVRPSQALRRRNDVRRLAGDASRLASATGWRPEISLEQTLADALEAARRAVETERMSPV